MRSRPNHGGHHDSRDPPLLIGESPQMNDLRTRIRKIGATDIDVLVHGETGSGKDPVAHHLHACSGRGRLVVLNCAGIPEPLLESELFGHVRGAFTGAIHDRIGRIQRADGGTLFLDEIGELALTLQAKLLRVLGSREVQRVGEDEVRHVNVRVIAATNRDLEQEVRQGRFREDLYYRLATAVIDVPPLRERGRDIRLLAEHFAGETSIAPQVFRLLETYLWPGNVRELKAAVEIAAVESGGGLILPEHLPERILSETDRVKASRREDQTEPGPPRQSENGRKLPEDPAEARRVIVHALAAAAGNKVRAADALAISRGYLYVKIRDLSIRADEWTGQARVRTLTSGGRSVSANELAARPDQRLRSADHG